MNAPTLNKEYAVVERLRGESRDALQTAVRQSLARAFSPPPKMPLDLWADKFRRLSPEAAALPGKWKTDNEPMARGVMRAGSDPLVEKVSAMCAAQILKTEFCLNLIAYYAHGDPAPMMYVMPTIEMAEALSTDRVAPMIRDTPVIKKLFGTKQRSTADKILHKSFPGGQLTFAGANSPASLSSRPKRVLLCDEVDRYPASSGGQGAKGEGDPVGLAEERTNTFFNRKIVLVSTPTNKGTSRIEQSYEEGDGRQFHVPCPHCGTRQVIAWAGVKWTSGDDGKPDPNTARYHCRMDAVDPHTGQLGCGKPWTEMERISAIDVAGRLPDFGWIAQRPFKGHASFHATQLASRRVPLARIVEKWINAQKSVERLRQFINTVLAETWEEGGEKADASVLYARREPYTAEPLPPEVGVITIGVDIQRNRWEAEVVGWGAHEESWSLAYKVHYADPSTPEYWRALDDFISQSWEHPTGTTLRAEATCVDSGDNTQAVYDFCRPRFIRRIFAIKGRSNSGKEPHPIWPKKATRNAGKKIDVFLLGLDNAKADTQSRLMLKEPGPGYCHFPIDDAYDEQHFTGLTIEKAVTRYQFGVPYREWHCPVGARNEPWDCRIYAYAALKSLVVNVAARLKAMRDDAKARAASPEHRPPAQLGGRQRRVRSAGVTA